MERRTFLTGVVSITPVMLSGCLGIFQQGEEYTYEDIPLSEQEPFLHNFPLLPRGEQTTTLTFQTDGDELLIRPLVFNNADSFKLYTVNPDGTGDLVDTIERGSYGWNRYDSDVASSGTILLILVVIDDVTYTYGAYYLDNSGRVISVPLDQ